MPSSKKSKKKQQKKEEAVRKQREKDEEARQKKINQDIEELAASTAKRNEEARRKEEEASRSRRFEGGADPEGSDISASRRADVPRKPTLGIGGLYISPTTVRVPINAPPANAQAPTGIDDHTFRLRYAAADTARRRLITDTEWLIDPDNAPINTTQGQERIREHQKYINVCTTALEDFKDHLFEAAWEEQLVKEMDLSGAEAERLEAHQRVLDMMHKCIEKSGEVAGLFYIDLVACRFCLSQGGSRCRKFPRNVPMLQVFRETEPSYQATMKELKAIALYMSVMRRISPQVKDRLLKWKDKMWKLRAEQLLHATVYQRLEEIAKKYFEDRDAWRLARGILEPMDKYINEAFKGVEELYKAIR